MAPGPLADDDSAGIDDELGVWPVPQRVLQPIVHGVHQPGNRGAQLFLGLPSVFQPFIECERLHVVANQLRVGQRLVDEEDLDPFGPVVPMHRLQTGDVP